MNRGDRIRQMNNAEQMKEESEFDNTDIQRLYDAFTELCDYVEQKTEGGCMECPYHCICFGMAGHVFAESLKKIKEVVGRMEE